MRNDFGPNFEDRLQVVGRPFKRLVNLQVLEIANVLAEKSAVGPGQAETIFQFRSDPEDAGLLCRQGYSPGDKPARTAYHRRPVSHDTHNGIIRPGVYSSIVLQKQVGNPCKPRTGLLIFIRNRFVGEVGAGHNQCQEMFFEQQVMQRRIRQHRSDKAVARGDFVRQQGRGFFLQQDNRPLDSTQQFRLRRAEICVTADLIEIARHDSERFLVAQFAAA